jgi:uncharacterized protein (TIGR00369 family)
MTQGNTAFTEGAIDPEDEVERQSALIPPPTSRLRFRNWSDADYPLAEALWCDQRVTHYFGGAMTVEQAHARMDAEREREAKLGVQYWPMELRETSEFAGCAGLRPWQYDSATMEVGVHLMPKAWGGRLGEEALRAVLAHGFGTLKLPVIVAGHGAAHANSRDLLERTGFRYTHNAIWGAKELDVRWYAIDAETWRMQNSTAVTEATSMENPTTDRMTPHDQMLALMNEMKRTLEQSGVQLRLPPRSHESMGVRFTHIDLGKMLTAEIPFHEEFSNPTGVMQGGFLCAAFDEVFGPLAYMAAGRPAATIEMSTSFLRPFQPKHKVLTVRAEVVSVSKSLLVLQAQATRPDGKLIAISKVQMLYTDKTAV